MNMNLKAIEKTVATTVSIFLSLVALSFLSAFFLHQSISIVSVVLNMAAFWCGYTVPAAIAKKYHECREEISDF